MRVGSQGSESEGGGSRLPQNSVWWSVVVANVCQFSGGPSHGSPVSQVSAPLLRLRSSCRPFVGTLLPCLSCSFSLPGVSNTCFHTFSFFCGFDFYIAVLPSGAGNLYGPALCSTPHTVFLVGLGYITSCLWDGLKRLVSSFRFLFLPRCFPGAPFKDGLAATTPRLQTTRCALTFN